MGSDNPTREVFTRSVVAAAERGDRLAFHAAIDRYGTGGLGEAQAVVRAKAVLRMVDRLAPPPGRTMISPVLYEPAVAARARGTEARDHVFGHFTVWDSWYEVDSLFEGHFLERTVQGSTKKTIAENGDQIRALFQHGQDPVAADKPLGPIRELKEDTVGAYYDVELLRDTDGNLVDYVRGIVPGLEAGLYGASFRFQVMREQWDDEPDPGDHNPNGLPERSLKEMRIMEFGPVTFPANPAATAQVRSRSDENSANGDGARKVTVAPPEPDAAATRAAPRETSAANPSRFRSEEEWFAWLTRNGT